jgi:TPR repeat protein
MSKTLSTRGFLAPAMAMAAITSLALAQEKAASPPPVAEDLRAAMAKADAGDASEINRLADTGRPDAQYYAGMMYITGRGTIAKDPPRGCAYEEKASAARADAMYAVGQCNRLGLTGKVDAVKAKAAYSRAVEMGSPPARCALGLMLMSEPGQAQSGLDMCKASAKAGDVDAQMAVAETYFNGGPVTADHGEARKWYAMAADANQPDAGRKLGEMYANGDGGKRDTKKALKLWIAAEKAGDRMAPILVADQLFSDMTGGKKPAPGQYKFRGGIPTGDIDAVSDWYREAAQVDPRPEVKQRAEYALQILASLKSAGQSVQVK